MLDAGVMRVRRGERKEATRRLLFETGMRLFATQGYENTPVEAITRTAGVAKGTFFNYFKTKEDLLLQVVEDQQEWLAGQLAALLAEPGPLAPRFTSLMVRLAARPRFTRPLLRTLVRVAMDSPHPGQVSQAAETVAAFLPVFAAGQERGEFTRSIPAGALARLAVQTYFAVLLHWSGALVEDPLDRWMELSFTALFDGIRAETEMAPQ